MASAPNNPKDHIKLIKDLKYGKVHLRQSLLELDEIEDLDKLYKNKRSEYQIEDKDEVVIDLGISQSNEQQIPAFLTPIERLALYRKQKMNKKIKDKMSKMLQDKPKNVTRIRKPKTEKLLDKFQERFKKEMPISYLDDLRESQINLSKIKKNDKFNLNVVTETKKPLYISRMHSEKKANPIEPNVENSTIQMHQESPRKRFMSLKTSLPERQKNCYTPIRQIVQGRNRDDHTKKVIDIKNIENQLDSYLNKRVFKKNNTYKRVQNNYLADDRNTSSQKVKTQNGSNFMLSSNIINKKRTKSNVNKSISKSQQSSKSIIDTMTNFYHSKHLKRESFSEMVQNLQYDRPLTSSIRRKNYKLLGRQSLSPIKQYRLLSQVQRKKIQQKNIQFYKSLFEGLERYHQDDIPTTIFLIDEVRHILESEYFITEEILNELVGVVQKMQVDTKTTQILNKIGDFVGYQITLNFE